MPQRNWALADGKIFIKIHPYLKLSIPGQGLCDHLRAFASQTPSPAVQPPSELDSCRPCLCGNMPKCVSLGKDQASSVEEFIDSDPDNRLPGLWDLTEKQLPWDVDTSWAPGVPPQKPQWLLTFWQISTRPTLKEQVKVPMIMERVLVISL